MHVVDDEALRLFQHAHINAIAYAYVRAVDSGMVVVNVDGFRSGSKWELLLLPYPER